MSEQLLNDGRQRSEPNALTWRERRRQRAIFRTRAVVTRAEHDRMKTEHVVRGERSPRRESHFDFHAGLQVNAAQTCGQRCRVVRDHNVAGP